MSIESIKKLFDTKVFRKSTLTKEPQRIELIYASMRQKVNIGEMQNCLDHGDVVHKITATGKNSLHQAALSGGNPRNMQFLVNNLEDPEYINAVTKDGYTALGFIKQQIEHLNSGNSALNSREELLKTVHILEKSGAKLSRIDKRSLGIGKLSTKTMALDIG